MLLLTISAGVSATRLFKVLSSAVRIVRSVIVQSAITLPKHALQYSSSLILLWSASLDNIPKQS